MTVETATPISTHDISGVGPYPVEWPYSEGSLVVSIEVGTVRTVLEAAQVVVDPVASDTTGNVFVLSPPGSGRVVIERVSPDEQGWQGILGERERGLERQLDRHTRADQELRAGLRGAVRVQREINPLVPVPGAAIIFDVDGQPVSGPTADQITGAQGAAAAAQASAVLAQLAAAAAIDAQDSIVERMPKSVTFRGDGIINSITFDGVYISRKAITVFVGQSLQVPLAPIGEAERYTQENDGSTTTLTFDQPFPKGALVFATAQTQISVSVADPEATVFPDSTTALDLWYGSRPFGSRASFLAAVFPASVTRAGYIDDLLRGRMLWFRRDTSHPCATSAGGVVWSPEGDATPEAYGWAVTQTFSDQTTAVIAALQSGMATSRFHDGRTYTVNYADANLAAPMTCYVDGKIRGSNDAAFLDMPVMRLNGGSVSRHRVIVIGGATGSIFGDQRTFLPGVASGSGLLIRYSDNWRVENLFFYSGESRTSGFGDSALVPEYCRKGTVVGCIFRGWNDHAIYGTAGAAGNAVQFADSLTIQNCHFSESGAGDVRFARDFHRLILIDNISVGSLKFLVVAGGATNWVTGDQIICSRNQLYALAGCGIDIRYTNVRFGTSCNENHLYGWAFAEAGPAIRLLGVAKFALLGNIIVPGAFLQAASATSCTTGIYVQGGTGDDGVVYPGGEGIIDDNLIEVFNRSAEAGPPANNACIVDRTSLATITNLITPNVYPFDIFTGPGVTDTSIGNPRVTRKSVLGTGFGGAIPTRILTVANNMRVVRADDATRFVDIDTTGTAHIIRTESPPASARSLFINVTTDAANSAVSGGTLEFRVQLLGLTKVTVGQTFVTFAVPAKDPSYTVGTVPSASAMGAGATIFVTNETGGATGAQSDGTNWRRYSDRAAIA